MGQNLISIECEPSRTKYCVRPRREKLSHKYKKTCTFIQLKTSYIAIPIKRPCKTPSGRKVTKEERRNKKEREKTLLIVDIAMVITEARQTEYCMLKK
jgi:hypothetical protein